MSAGQEKWLLREAEDGDFPRLVELEQLCFSDPWSEASLRSGAAAPGTVRVLTEADGGRILGYTVTRRILDEAELLRIGVDPTERGNGLGKQLLDAFLEEEARLTGVINELMEMVPENPLEKVTQVHISLDVRVGNAPAIALYEHAGFRKVARMKNYYSGPTEDGLRMVKELC